MSKNNKKQANPLLGKILFICLLLAIGFVLTDACFFADGFKEALVKGEYSNLANYVFYLIGFASLVLYGLFFYKKSPAFYRGLLIFSVAFFALMIGTKINLLSYETEIYSGIANAKRVVRIIQIAGLAVNALIALLIGIVASRLSQKDRNHFLLNVAAVLAWVYGIISVFTNLFIVGKLSEMGIAEICAAISDLVPAIYMTVVSMSYVLGSEVRHSDDPMFDED